MFLHEIYLEIDISQWYLHGHPPSVENLSINIAGSQPSVAVEKRGRKSKADHT